MMRTNRMKPDIPPHKPFRALFPGCSLEASAQDYAASLREVFSVLAFDIPTMRHWNCCGSSSAHAVDDAFFYALNLRNLALAEEQGIKELIVPCAACFHRIASVNDNVLGDREMLKSLNALNKLNYRGEVKVLGLLEFLAGSTSPSAIAAKARHPLSHLKIACYYGCLSVRPPRGAASGAADASTIMESITASLGAEPVNWSYKTDCCGAGHFITAPASCQRLSAQILADASACGAHAIAVACPMCHNNLDTRQPRIRKKSNIPNPLPVLYLSQLMGLAFGLSPRRLGIHRHFVKLPSSWT